MTIRVLIVDDSTFMRIVMRKMVAECPDISVVGEARDGRMAVQMAQALRPDVITMDVEMPEMDGLTATQEIMATAPCSIIMVSSLTDRGAQATLKALALGAVDFIPKKSSFIQLDIVQIGAELVNKIRFWKPRSRAQRPAAAAMLPPPAAARITPAGKVGLVVVAVSTGGPAMMQGFLSSMGTLDCPVIIAQHMPAVFTRGFAEHMRSETGLNVVEGHNAMPLAAGMVVIAPGGTDSIVREPFSGKLTLYLKTHESAPIHPNADVLFQSAASLSVGVVAVILTGMGSDGTEGAKVLARRQSPVLVQDPSTCVVDGMPTAAQAAGVVSDVLSPQALGRQLAKWCN